MAPQSSSHARARRAFGQNFLTDPAAIRRIADAADPGRDALVYEVGAGRGRLTAELLTRCRRVVAYEIDAEMAGHLPQDRRLTVRTGDFLAAQPPGAEFTVDVGILQIERRRTPMVAPDRRPAYARLVEAGFTGEGGSLAATLSRRYSPRRAAAACRAARIGPDVPVGAVWPEQWLTLFSLLEQTFSRPGRR